MTSPITKYNNLTQRIITGLLGAAGIITGVCINEWTYCLIFCIICLFLFLSSINWLALTGSYHKKPLVRSVEFPYLVLSFLIEKGAISDRYYFLIFPIVSFVYMIKLYKKFERKPFTNIAFTFLGIFYVAVPISLLNVAVFENDNYNYEIIFGCLFILWASDTGAYFAGTFFGRRKLFERISPKKSWEGFFGGALLALVFAYGLVIISFIQFH